MPTSRYSLFSLASNAISYHRNWPKAWRSPEPKPMYDVIIVGGGGHGLATAYYLAKEHNITNVAIVEKGWIGGGNTGRNTTIIRSNYLWDESAAIYEKSLQLYEGLSRELNFNLMVSQRGVLNLAHNQHDLHEFNRAQVSVGLGFNGDPQDLPYLRDMADGENHYVAQSAITALSIFSGDKARDVLDELAQKHSDSPRGDLMRNLLKQAYDWPPVRGSESEEPES